MLRAGGPCSDAGSLRGALLDGMTLLQRFTNRPDFFDVTRLPALVDGCFGRALAWLDPAGAEKGHFVFPSAGVIGHLLRGPPKRR